jgi:hypothetical protein
MEYYLMTGVVVALVASIEAYVVDGKFDTEYAKLAVLTVLIWPLALVFIIWRKK